MFENSKLKKICFRQKNTQTVNLTGENLPKELLDEIRSENCSDTDDRQNYSKVYDKIQTKRQSVREKKRRLVSSCSYQP